MTTWQAWRNRYPETTVLDLSRTSKSFTKDFYGEPSKFVVGFQGTSGMHHCSFATLMSQPLHNVMAGRQPVLLLFDKDSTSARLFDRRVDDRVLTFTQVSDSELRDAETSSSWDVATAAATAGPLEGQQLAPLVGIPSFTRSWLQFHPNSQQVGN